VPQQRVGGAVEVVDHLAADHEMRHQREERDRDQQVDVELAEDDLAERPDPALEVVAQRPADDAEPGEDRDARSAAPGSARRG
jgi:hypothetical protein